MSRMPSGIVARRRPLREWFPVLAFAVAVACPAGADVVVKQKTISEGLAGFGNSTIEQTQTISGEKSRNEDLATYTGRMKSLAGKPRQSITITRLDRELIWNLDPEKKEYSELTFAQMRDMAGKAMADAPQEAKAPDADMTFSVDVRKTGVKQEVNGFAAEQVIVTCTGKPADPKKSESPSEVTMKMDLWLTKAAGNAEAQAFHRKLAEKLGHDLAAGTNEAAMRMYGKGMKELAAKFKDLDGFPVRTTTTIENTLPPEQQKELEQAQKEMAKAQAEAEAGKSADKAAAAEQEKQEDAEDVKTLGKLIGSGGNPGSALGGLFGKKAKKEASKKADAAAEKQVREVAGAGPPSGGPLFKSVTDVLSITSAPAPAGSFEVPAGYKLKPAK